jgi:hypothetical protein
MAIHPYPSASGARWQLPGGAIATVRPIRPEEGETLADNTAMWRLAARFGFTIRPDPESADTCLLEKTL